MGVRGIGGCTRWGTVYGDDAASYGDAPNGDAPNGCCCWAYGSCCIAGCIAVDAHCGPGWAYWGSFSTHAAASSQAAVLQRRGYYTQIERSYGKYYLYYQ